MLKSEVDFSSSKTWRKATSTSSTADHILKQYFYQKVLKRIFHKTKFRNLFFIFGKRQIREIGVKQIFFPNLEIFLNQEKKNEKLRSSKIGFKIRFESFFLPTRVSVLKKSLKCGQSKNSAKKKKDWKENRTG